jgi:uncharacterized membrane protein YfcA
MVRSGSKQPPRIPSNIALMPPIETIAIIALTFLLAGLVKGVIGLGVPTVSLAVLTATLGLEPAMALLLMPSFVTNLWQGLAGSALPAILKRLWPLLAAVCIGTWFGVSILAAADKRSLSALLGAVLAVYAAINLVRPALPAPGRAERWLSPLVGAVNGALTGMTGSFVVPGVPYLQALGLPRDVLIQAMGVLFTVSTAALAAALGDQRLLSLELGGQSLAAVVPALLGMVLGQRLRRRLSEAAFRKTFFCALLVLGIYIAGRALT